MCSLNELHGFPLPIESGLRFRSIHRSAPSYLSDLITIKNDLDKHIQAKTNDKKVQRFDLHSKLDGGVGVVEGV